MITLQQMARSQQMDELLDVLIESGGEHTHLNTILVIILIGGNILISHVVKAQHINTWETALMNTQLNIFCSICGV